MEIFESIFVRQVAVYSIVCHCTRILQAHHGEHMLERYPALKYPRYRRYWLASFASVGATQLTTLGQGWLIFELSGSALQLGYLGAAAALPNILMTLIGGVIADRFDKRIILMCTSAFITALLGLLAWLDFTGQVAVWQVLTVAALFSLTTGLDWPVRVSIFPQLVDRSAFMSAVALNSFIWQVTRMALPAIGGVIIAVSDTWVIFAFGAIGFATMFLVISRIHVTVNEHSGDSPLNQIKEGVHFIWTNELFRWLLILTFVGMFFSMSYVQIMPVFADLLGTGETGYGYLLSAGGVGSVVGTLVMGGAQGRPNLGRLLLGSAALSVVSLLLFCILAAAGWYVGTLVMSFATSAFASIFLVGSMTVLQLTVPDRLRGRVMGIHTIGFSLSPLGGLLLGGLTELLSAPTAVVIGSSVYLICIIWLAVYIPLLRRLDGTALSGEKQP
jgi:MFS family permease